MGLKLGSGPGGHGRHRRVAAFVALLVVSAAVAITGSGTGAGASEGEHHELMPGVEHVHIARGGPHPLVADVARIGAEAEVDLRVVAANDRVGGQDMAGRELTSGACRRVGGLVCVNGDYALCTACGQPYGGVVTDGRVLRSFRPDHEHVTRTAEGFTTERLVWGGHLLATYSWTEQPDLTEGLLGQEPTVRTETRTLPLAGLNVPRPDNAVVLYTRDWADTTQTPGGLEVQLTTAEPVKPGSVPTTFIARHAAGGTPIPPGGAVLSATGPAADELARFWDEWHGSDAEKKELVLESAVNVPAVQSVGGHPVLLRDGARQPLDPADNKVTQRHPRTLVGWNPQGQLLLVTVDGRQPGRSHGLTLHEATDLMIQLGATDAVNLDGGGSSTFVGPCPGGPCVLNHPSDGRERPASNVLAVVPRSVVAAAPPPSAPAAASLPEPPATPPPAPAPDPASTPKPIADPPPPPAPAPEPEATPAPAVTTPAPAVEPEPVERRPARRAGPVRRAPAPRPAAPDGLPAVPVGAAVVLLVATAAGVAVQVRRARSAPA